jgi:hypothetical protein
VEPVGVCRGLERGRGVSGVIMRDGILGRSGLKWADGWARGYQENLARERERPATHRRRNRRVRLRLAVVHLPDRVDAVGVSAGTVGGVRTRINRPINRSINLRFTFPPPPKLHIVRQEESGATGWLHIARQEEDEATGRYEADRTRRMRRMRRNRQMRSPAHHSPGEDCLPATTADIGRGPQRLGELRWISAMLGSSVEFHEPRAGGWGRRGDMTREEAT